VALAYCILAHKNPDQLARLLRAIWHRANFYVVHYEKRAPRAEHERVARLVDEFPNVRLLRPRAILWGRFGVIGTQLEAVVECLRWSESWSHVFTLSGQDYPLRVQREMVDEMASVADTTFMSHFDPWTSGNWKNTAERVERVYFESPLLEWLLGLPGAGRRIRSLFGWSNSMPFVPGVRRKKPGFFQYTGGSNHVVLSCAAARHVVRDQKAQKITRWLRRSGIPDESVFQSVLMNSPLADTVTNDDRRAIYWDGFGSISPRTLTPADLPALLEARAQGKLFTRKVCGTQYPGMIDLLEEKLQLLTPA
jgi:hypothetical protein